MVLILHQEHFNTLRLKQNCRHFADDIFKCSWMKMYEFRLRFHWNLFLRLELTISQHWFRWWLGANQATSHYLSEPIMVGLLTHICVTRPQWVELLLPSQCWELMENIVFYFCWNKPSVTRCKHNIWLWRIIYYQCFFISWNLPPGQVMLCFQAPWISNPQQYD